MANGGVGILIRFPGGQIETASKPAGRYCTNYRAETDALVQAASIVHAAEDPCQQVVFLSDALSVLQSLENDKLPYLTEAIMEVSRDRRAVLQWIPAHCGIQGNERADELAKQGARTDQPDNSVSFSEKKSIIRSLHRPHQEKDDYHLLSREHQVILMRLRTGHNRLNAHMHRKLKLAPTPSCPCGHEEQTSDHILQRCPLLQEERIEVWPTATSLMTKLHGSLEDLEKTASFITSCGLTV